MRVIIAIVAVLAVISGVQGQSGPPGVITALKQQIAAFESAFAKQDAAAAAQLFTSYGVFLSDAFPPFAGTSGVEAALQGLMDEGTVAFDLTLKSALVLTDDPYMAYSLCSYVKQGKDGVLDTGFSSLTWVMVSSDGNLRWEPFIVASVTNITSSAMTMAQLSGVQTMNKFGMTIAPHSNIATIEAAQSFFNKFQQIFNSKGSSADYKPLLDSSINIYTKGHQPVSGVTVALEFLTKALPAKGYSFVGVTIVEAGSHSSDLYFYARGTINFFDENGAVASLNNFLAVLTGTATSPSGPTLLAMNVVPTVA